MCLLRGGIKREDLPAELSDITYPVNCYCSFKQSDCAFIPAYLTFEIDSNCTVVIISFTVPVHTKQARDLHPRIRRGISPLVRLCPFMWPAGQDPCARHQPGNVIHMIIWWKWSYFLVFFYHVDSENFVGHNCCSTCLIFVCFPGSTDWQLNPLQNFGNWSVRVNSTRGWELPSAPSPVRIDHPLALWGRHRGECAMTALIQIIFHILHICKKNNTEELMSGPAGGRRRWGRHRGVLAQIASIKNVFHIFHICNIKTGSKLTLYIRTSGWAPALRAPSRWAFTKMLSYQMFSTFSTFAI